MMSLMSVGRTICDYARIFCVDVHQVIVTAAGNSRYTVALSAHWNDSCAACGFGGVKSGAPCFLPNPRGHDDVSLYAW
jgi:hypothetical protein